MDSAGIFPFGQPVRRLAQRDRTRKKIFVLGVYASAVHACWIGPDGRQKINAVAVASEPEIFWCGGDEAARSIISAIKLPHGAGSLLPASSRLNGPSGRALDELFLHPLKLTRDDAWLCDLISYSCMNKQQELALKREYDTVAEAVGLPAYEWPKLPKKLSDEQRRDKIMQEVLESDARVLITLGDEPLKWFTTFYGSESKLSAYGRSTDEYGQLHPITLAAQKIHLLPLVHPRQAAKLGSHSTPWAALHEQWVEKPPDEVMATLALSTWC